MQDPQKRGYPSNTCHRWILQGKRQAQRRLKDDSKEEQRSKDDNLKHFFLKVRYHPLWESKKAGTFRESMKNSISQCSGSIGLKYSKSRAPNIRDYINRSNLELLQMNDSRLFHLMRELEDNLTTNKRIRLL